MGHSMKQKVRSRIRAVVLSFLLEASQIDLSDLRVDHLVQQS